MEKLIGTLFWALVSVMCASAFVSIPVLASGVTRVSGCLVLYQELAWREVLQ